MGHSLILNADYAPLSFLPISSLNWKDAIKIKYLGHARVVEEYSDWVVHSPSLELAVPSVMISESYIKTRQSVKFSRANLLIRDNFTCQYCLKPLEYRDLTVDHVIPRVRGGKTSWDNIVASCYVCNTIKGHKQHMKPRQRPHKPDYHQLVANAKKLPIVIPDASWLPYLNWDPNLITIQSPNKKNI
jgi:5-methylcytosine-specific restriction endonuclease McrA